MHTIKQQDFLVPDKAFWRSLTADVKFAGAWDENVLTENAKAQGNGASVRFFFFFF